MMNAVRDEKAALRREIFAARAAMPFDRRKAADAAITEALTEWDVDQVLILGDGMYFEQPYHYR